MSLHNSQACCTTPVPEAIQDYSPQGTYATYADTKCYITGPSTATKAIFFIYDIFGFQPATLQGADILAQSGGYLVVAPDLLDGNVAQAEWFARDTEEKKQKVQEFLGRLRDPAGWVERIGSVLEGLKGAYVGVERWGAIGYCWGGKLVSITSGADTPWSVGIQSSPGAVDAEDAKKITVPMMMLASQGEPADAVKAFEDALTVPKVVETFGSQVHGWMSARADLANEEVRVEYQRGYQMAVDFFGKYL